MEARNLPRHMRAEITAYYSDIWTRHTGAGRRHVTPLECTSAERRHASYAHPSTRAALAHMLTHCPLLSGSAAHDMVAVGALSAECERRCKMNNPILAAAYHDNDFFGDLPAALRGKVARYRTRPCVANSELGQVPLPRMAAFGFPMGDRQVLCPSDDLAQR